MKFGVVGCGYVATMYASTLGFHPELQLAGAFDTNAANLDSFVARWPATRFGSLDDLLADRSIDAVLNLSNPRSHFDINQRCIEAGKHVYSEKPLAMTGADALSLAKRASQRGVTLSSAPCSVLSETAQTLWHAIRSSAVGRIRLVYANFDDGMIAPNQSPWNWRDERGVAWPAKDEFEVGCTYEHAGYVLTWLCAFFGPARRVTAFSSLQLPDKGIRVDSMAPDFSVGCLEFDDGVVARVTCGLVAPRDKSLTVVGDDGVLFVGNVRDDGGPVFVRQYSKGRIESGLARRLQRVARWLEARVPASAIDLLFASTYSVPAAVARTAVSERKRVDFLLGPAEMADAIRNGRAPRLSADFAAHIVEIVEALQYPERFQFRKETTTAFEPMAPMPWAQ